MSFHKILLSKVENQRRKEGPPKWTLKMFYLPLARRGKLLPLDAVGNLPALPEFTAALGLGVAGAVPDGILPPPPGPGRKFAISFVLVLRIVLVPV
jgi:hypothetical protein